MPAVRAQRLGFAFESISVFESLDFHLTAGWCGLTGANGTGKTTLLRLLLGELSPSNGSLAIEPKGARVVWCPQRVEERDGLIDALAEASDGVARRLQGRLKLDPATLARWRTLSPGERKRWQLGAALWSEPDVLLLDEPGNHLDAIGLTALRSALRTFGGLGVLVSHDRALLDDVTSSTLRLTPSGARLWPGGYSQARALWLREEEALQRARRDARQRLENEEHKLAARRRTLASASQQRSTGARMKSRRDSDARTMGADFRAEQAERAHAAALRRVEQSAARVRSELHQLEVHDEAGQALFLRYAPCPKPTVLQLNGDVSAGDTLVLRGVSLQLARDGRLWVRGSNGSGKTSLLQAALASGSGIPHERRLVLPQELTLEESLTDLEVLKALPAAERGRVLQMVHALGVEPERLLASPAPSPGESRKLRLALGLGRHAWLAVLDEPTNHLDLPAIERLSVALAAFPGALLLVTHDEQLGQSLGCDELDLHGARAPECGLPGTHRTAN